MDIQEKVDHLDNQLKKQGRMLYVTMGLLILTIAVLVTQKVLSIEGQTDVQGKRVYVHRGGGSLITTTIYPHGLESHRFTDKAQPYGLHAVLGVTADTSRLTLRENSAARTSDLDIFVSSGQSGLSIRDGNQNERIRLSLNEDGPKLVMMDEAGDVVFQAP